MKGASLLGATLMEATFLGRLCGGDFTSGRDGWLPSLHVKSTFTHYTSKQSRSKLLCIYTTVTLPKSLRSLWVWWLLQIPLSWKSNLEIILRRENLNPLHAVWSSKRLSLCEKRGWQNLLWETTLMDKQRQQKETSIIRLKMFRWPRSFRERLGTWKQVSTCYL